MTDEAAVAILERVYGRLLALKDLLEFRGPTLVSEQLEETCDQLFMVLDALSSRVREDED